MSLSEQELRALREIEQSLLADDPQFGSAVSGVDAAGEGFNFSLQGVALFVLGLVGLIGGIALSQANLWFIALSVVGFLLMFGSGLWMLRGGDRKSGGSLPNARSAFGGKNSGSHDSSDFTRRMDERFRSRFEDRP